MIILEKKINFHQGGLMEIASIPYWPAAIVCVSLCLVARVFHSVGYLQLLFTVPAIEPRQESLYLYISDSCFPLKKRFSVVSFRSALLEASFVL